MIVGIDLGTTNSLVAAFLDGEPRLIPNALGHNLTPSVVGLDDDGQVLVGLAARERLLTHPGLTTALFKRYMGSSREVELGRKKFRPEELSSLVLRSLKADAEAFLGAPVEEAIVTVPAYFSEAQRRATRTAGELAGLKVERLLNEPTAAALAYGMHQAHLESKFLVFDLGGGTFDVSVLELFEGVIEVRASTGDNFLGGEDFVEALYRAFLERVAAPAGVAERDLDVKSRARLREALERAKRELSSSPSTEVVLPFKGETLRWSIDGGELQKIAEPLLQRLRAPVERALRDARIRAADLDEIVLAGGATRMPIVRKLVAHLFGRFPSTKLDPDEVVAIGAAVQAGLKSRDSALDELVMTDVCPYTLGTQVSVEVSADRYESGLYLPIIERNTPIPASRTQSVTSIRDYASSLTIEVYQGESRWVRDNIRLGSLNIKIPRKKAREVEVEIRYTYDTNGLLECEVRVPETGKLERLVIQENPGAMSPKQIEQRLAELAKLKIHPRDEQQNRTVMARAERCYQEHLGPQREAVGMALVAFRQALEGQDPRTIEKMRQQLAEFLDRIEGEPYL
jgi:molecular chaperone HscC